MTDNKNLHETNFREEKSKKFSNEKKFCGLLGRKLSHSYSPAIHAAFGGYDYSLFEVEPHELDNFFETNNFHGINVTIPYKQDVVKFCAELSPTAEKISSVNTILRKQNGELFGDNTDAAGFEKMVDALKFPVSNKKVIIFGSGGSSLSVRFVMKKLGAREIIVVPIEENTPQNLARHADAQLLVNCTPSECIRMSANHRAIWAFSRGSRAFWTSCTIPRGLSSC